MSISKNIFRDYDIRGIVPNELNDETAFTIGRALGTFAIKKFGKKNPEILVGRDNRESSPSLAQNLIDGLVTTGCTVTDCGISLTPIIHFAMCTHKFHIGVEVTASHNPKKYNGFRIDYVGADPFYGEDIQTLYNLSQEEQFTSNIGRIKQDDLFEDYLSFLKKTFSFNGAHKIVVNCGNGTTSFFAEKIFSELGCNAIAENCIPDESYPLGVPDPESREYAKELSRLVGKNTADIGIGYDTDSDRFGVVDSFGKIYENDKVLLMLAKYHLQENPGATVAFDVKCTGLLNTLIKEWGGVPLMVKTGHPYLFDAMKKGADLGAEYSGHVFFGGDYFGYDDGIFASLKVLELMQKTGKSLADLMSDFPLMTHTSEIKIPCTEERKLPIVEKIKQKVKQTEFSDINEVDGVRVTVSPDSWFLIRASNTTPFLSLRAEAASEEALRLILEGVVDLLNGFADLDLTAISSAEIYES